MSSLLFLCFRMVYTCRKLIYKSNGFIKIQNKCLYYHCISNRMHAYGKYFRNFANKFKIIFKTVIFELGESLQYGQFLIFFCVLAIIVIIVKVFKYFFQKIFYFKIYLYSSFLYCRNLTGENS